LGKRPWNVLTLLRRDGAAAHKEIQWFSGVFSYYSFLFFFFFFFF
jgi:hypothetical protein